ncbi:TPA: hypothetical protein HA351_10625 [Methanosarcinaceae archaeon]|nr:hypothetical protein [Methanosarcinaceae archaeon]
MEKRNRSKVENYMDFARRKKIHTQLKGDENEMKKYHKQGWKIPVFLKISGKKEKRSEIIINVKRKHYI